MPGSPTLHRLDPDRSALVTRRFDRDGPLRLAYISADTLLQKRPGEVISYVELVEAAGDVAADPRAVRTGMFTRVALTLMIGNVDDHMKNHGLVRAPGGWAWSPAFDVNPFPEQFPVESTPIAGIWRRTGTERLRCAASTGVDDAAGEGEIEGTELDALATGTATCVGGRPVDGAEHAPTARPTNRSTTSSGARWRRS